MPIIYIYFFFRKFKFWQSLQKNITIDPLWPIFWIDYTGTQFGSNLIFLVGIFGSFLAAYFSHIRSFRIISFIGFFEFVALDNSFGKINHTYHTWLFFSFFIIFLPKGRLQDISKSLTKRHKYLTVFFSTQIVIMLTYTLSGLWRIYYGVTQFLNGENGIFHPQAIAIHVSRRLLETDISSILGSFVIENYYLAWPFFLTAVYLEAFSIIAIFRFGTHRLWGILLISMHLGIGATMGIFFNESVILLGMLMVCSPFNNSELSLKGQLLKFPFVQSSLGILLKIRKKFRT